MADRPVAVNNVAERLGYPPDTKLLIIHVDDLGMCHSVNVATFKAFEAGAISSASVMVPCPWFAEVAEYCRREPSLDIGVHLTITSEWSHYKWRPLSDVNCDTGLVDKIGHFLPALDSVYASPSHIEVELDAQVKTAMEAGINITHLDSHMFSLFRTDYANIYAETAKKYRLPFLVPRCSFPPVCASQAIGEIVLNSDLVVDRLFQASPDVPADSWEDYYLGALSAIESGLNQLTVHLGWDDGELRAITKDHRAWGAAWRQRDYDVVMSSKFRSALRENQITVVDWRTVASILQKPKD